MNCNRTDWLMRQFCDEIAEALGAGMKRAEAYIRMTARGVPRHVQYRICDNR